MRSKVSRSELLTIAAAPLLKWEREEINAKRVARVSREGLRL
jgi:hypothetical protein